MGGNKVMEYSVAFTTSEQFLKQRYAKTGSTEIGQNLVSYSLAIDGVGENFWIHYYGDNG